MGKQPRLEDLYVTGREETFSDGVRSVTVWIQPLNTPEQEIAQRKASAKRATALMWRHDPTCEDYLAIRDQVELLDDQYVIEYLVADELYEREAAVEAEEADDEEWSKDDYLSGLRDAWEPPNPGEVGLKEVYFLGADDPDTNDRFPEAVRCLTELKRFRTEVDDRMAPIIEHIRMTTAAESMESLRDRCTRRYIESAGEVAWAEEYRRCQIWLGTRSAADHNERYFSSRDAIDRLPDEVFLRLRQAHQAITVDVVAGKDSPASPSSSPSSEPSAAEETEHSSGLVAASA